MTTLIEDSPRANLAGWIGEAVQNGTASGAVLTPWASPYVHRGGPGLKPGIGKRTEELRDSGIPYWFDPMTHVLQMTGVGDYRYYREYPLWGGPQGDLTLDSYRREHVRRVFRLQNEVGALHLAPAPLLPSGLNNLSTLALDTAKAAMDLEPDTYLTIAGTSSFWSDAGDLDAHVGALAALQPSGWFISFVQPSNDLPPAVTADEVFGVARTVRALSEYAPVHISHGDFAALPAVAAGAYSVGTGWDKRQRVVAYSDYGPRPVPVPGEQQMGGWLERPTLAGLLGSLGKSDGALLSRQDPALATRLGGLPSAPGAKDAYLHHVAQLQFAISRVEGAATYEQRFRDLDAMYTAAAVNWAALQTSTGIRDASSRWIFPYQQGLRMYALSEGWTA
ncbi:hypothetical protein [Leifsonia sp. C5G2]|uniref:hypothetical protein n=1 Tax=Leifsonia sp. C5G2 TaxID=2735269 RepID=UPI0015856271|nr:hypothetical protein [Leifsonia sp. C5G2]